MQEQPGRSMALAVLCDKNIIGVVDRKNEYKKSPDVFHIRTGYC